MTADKKQDQSIFCPIHHELTKAMEDRIKSKATGKTVYWIIGVLVVIFMGSMGGSVGYLAIRADNNGKSIADNTKLIQNSVQSMNEKLSAEFRKIEGAINSGNLQSSEKIASVEKAVENENKAVRERISTLCLDIKELQVLLRQMSKEKH